MDYLEETSIFLHELSDFICISQSNVDLKQKKKIRGSCGSSKPAQLSCLILVPVENIIFVVSFPL